MKQVHESGEGRGSTDVRVKHVVEAAGNHVVRFCCALWVYNCTGLPIALQQVTDFPSSPDPGCLTHGLSVTTKMQGRWIVRQTPTLILSTLAPALTKILKHALLGRISTLTLEGSSKSGRTSMVSGARVFVKQDNYNSAQSIPGRIRPETWTYMTKLRTFLDVIRSSG